MAYEPDRRHLSGATDKLMQQAKGTDIYGAEVIKRCTIELGKCIHSATEAVESFDRSTTRLTKHIIVLYWIIASATVVGAAATVIAVVVGK